MPPAGRDLRQRAHDEPPLVIDLVDDGQPMFTSQLRKRVQYYNSKKFDVRHYDNLANYVADHPRQSNKRACIALRTRISPAEVSPDEDDEDDDE